MAKKTQYKTGIGVEKGLVAGAVTWAIMALIQAIEAGQISWANITIGSLALGVLKYLHNLLKVKYGVSLRG